MSVFKKNDNSFYFNFFRYLCFTGISGNLAETPILKDIFIFLAVIKSCRANFGVKWRVFFSTSIFVQKCQFLGKKNWISWEMLIFSNNCALLLKVNILLENMLIFRKLWLLCDCLYTSRNCRILIKTSIFLRKFLFVHVLIFIKVFYLWKIVILIQNIISFGDILDKSVIFW